MATCEMGQLSYGNRLLIKHMFTSSWALAEGLKGVMFSLVLPRGQGGRCVLDVDAGKSWERRNCTTSVLASTSTKFN